MFGFGKKSFLGIDIGTSSIKVVEIKISNNKPVLANYAWIKMGGTTAENQSDFSDAAIVKYLQKILLSAKFKSKDAYVSMPAFGGLITLIEFPEMNKEDLDQAIKFEAHKYIPTSLDDIALSWDILNKKNPLPAEKNTGGAMAVDPAAEGAKLQVLLVAAPKSKVEKYQKIIREAGLELKSIEIESFSLLRALVGNDIGNFIIIDIGFRICNIILVEKGVIKVNRNIDAGGRDITKAISRGMNLNEDRAEKFKIEGGHLLNQESMLKLTTLDVIIDETKRVLNAYYKNEGEKGLDSIILSGGTAGINGIAEYFSQALQIKTVVGNPLSRIECEPKLQNKLKEIGPQLSVSLGLALKGAEEYLKK